MKQGSILITGANGQLGHEFRKIACVQSDIPFVFTDIDELDITSADQVTRFLDQHPIGSIINCAAYTAVDKAEEERERAMAVNAKAVRNLAVASRNRNALLVHISTDYVFDGRHFRPYSETDRENPLSWYGLSKLEGERQVMMHAGSALILRTSWLYSATGNNFLKTILGKSKEKKELRIVCDQTGTPTYAKDLARAIMSIIPGFKADEKRIYHFSNEGICSWYDFASEIVERAGHDCRVVPINTSDYPTAALRPFYSAMDKTKIKKDFGLDIPHWKDGVNRCMQELGYSRKY
jgi:dTDP-4-dehydrorhamnose reductase